VREKGRSETRYPFAIMGILRFTASVSPEFECEVPEPLLTYDLRLVRPCERYKQIFSACRSLRGRLHQYYVYGELFDCSNLKENYSNCKKFRATQDVEFLKSIVEWEKNLIETRLAASLNNPVWKLRDSPPEDFDGPLPEFIRQRQKGSFLYRSNNGR